MTHQARTLTKILLLLALLYALLPQAGWAQAVPAHISAVLPQAKLSGSGAYRWFGLKLYDARLWTDKQNVALDLDYARELVGKRIATASIDEIKKLSIGTAAQHSAWLASMTAIFPDVKKGTHITGVLVAGQATRFFLNGAPLGEIADPEFGPAFFAIWLDPKTSEPSLRRALLGIQ
jgi:hypothetical protein